MVQLLFYLHVNINQDLNILFYLYIKWCHHHHTSLGRLVFSGWSEQQKDFVFSFSKSQMEFHMDMVHHFSLKPSFVEWLGFNQLILSELWISPAFSLGLPNRIYYWPVQKQTLFLITFHTHTICHTILFFLLN